MALIEFSSATTTVVALGMAAFALAGLFPEAAHPQTEPLVGDQVFFEDAAVEGAPSFEATSLEGAANTEEQLINGDSVPPSVTTIVRLRTPHRCTATLVEARTLVTAAHCLLMPDGSLSGAITVTIGREVVSGRCSHPSTYPGNKAHDLATCLLGRTIGNVSFESVDAASDIHVGDDVVLTGYGCTQNGTSDGILRYGVGAIMHPNDTRGTPGLIGTQITPSSAGLCSGDSGGPLFVFFTQPGAPATWNTCRRQIAANTAVNSRASLFTPLNRPPLREFLEKWSANTGQKICGLNSDGPQCHC